MALVSSFLGFAEGFRWDYGWDVDVEDTTLLGCYFFSFTPTVEVFFLRSTEPRPFLLFAEEVTSLFENI